MTANQGGEFELEILPFEAVHIDEAVGILAERHRADRELRPELPERFERPEHARDALAELIDKGNATGAVAVRDGRLTGYLLGSTRHSEIRERHVWIDYAGSALAAGENAELHRDLYAVAGREWVKRGCFKHYAVVPGGGEDGAQAWFRLGFGHEQVHGILDLSTADRALPPPRDYEIRLARQSDEAAVRSIATTIWEYQTQAPTWAAALPEEAAKLRDGYVELLADETVQFWLAVGDGEVLGYQVLWPNETSRGDLMTPDGSICLGVGGTVPRARRSGVGTSLVRRGLAEASAAGFTFCTADWRMTSLSSSRFWPKQGFRPVAYRLFRQVDPRIAWATL